MSSPPRVSKMSCHSRALLEAVAHGCGDQTVAIGPPQGEPGHFWHPPAQSTLPCGPQGARCEYGRVGVPVRDDSGNFF